MDTERFYEAQQKLEILDERMAHKIRPSTSGGLIRPTTEQLEKRVAELASYTLELKDVVNQLFQAIAAPAPREP